MDRPNSRKRRFTTTCLPPQPSKQRRRISTLPSSSQPITPFVPHLTVTEADKLKKGDPIDHRDFEGRFIMATIEDIRGTRCLIHYIGWDRQYDIWSDRRTEIHRFAKAGSISRRKAQRLFDVKEGVLVDINPLYRCPGWTAGSVERTDSKSDQVGVRYHGKSWWTHLDNVNEIDMLGTHSMAVSSDQNDEKLDQHQKEKEQVQQAQKVGNREVKSKISTEDNQSRAESQSPSIVPEQFDDCNSAKEQIQRSEYCEEGEGVKCNKRKELNMDQIMPQNVENKAFDGNRNGAEFVNSEHNKSMDMVNGIESNALDTMASLQSECGNKRSVEVDTVNVETVDPMAVQIHSDNSIPVKESRKEQGSQSKHIEGGEGVKSDGLKQRNGRNHWNEQHSNRVMAQNIDNKAADRNTTGADHSDPVWTSYQIVKCLNRIENGKFLDLKYKNLKEMIRTQNISIFRVSMINNLVLRMCGIENPEDIQCLLSHFETLVDSQSAALNSKRCSRKMENYYTRNVPVEYLCPLSLELMTDPVLVTTTGLSYERQHIEHYLHRFKVDPMDNKKTNSSDLAKNKTLKVLIQKWMKQNE